MGATAGPGQALSPALPGPGLTSKLGQPLHLHPDSLEVPEAGWVASTRGEGANVNRPGCRGLPDLFA